MVVENHSNSKNIIKYSQKHSNNLHHEPIRPQSTILKFIQREPLLNEVTQTSKSSDCEVEYAIPTSFPIEIQDKNQIATQNFKCKKSSSSNHCKCRKMGYNCNSDGSCFNINCKNLNSIV
jgi:hypothetical protein